MYPVGPLSLSRRLKTGNQLKKGSFVNDMTQSPGRESPGSSSGSTGSSFWRNWSSTSTLDSRRSSKYHSDPRGCFVSYSGCSNSPENYVGSPDDRDLYAWLDKLKLEEYFFSFAWAGYDLATITRMTPADLAGIGIQKPDHRIQLKAEIDKLNIGDGLPEHIPEALEEWLGLLRLEEYLGTLHQQGIRSVEDVTTLAWEDFEDIGISRLGHQKKLVLAIERVKDILTGKRKPIQPLDTTYLHPHPGRAVNVVIQRGGDLPLPDSVIEVGGLTRPVAKATTTSGEFKSLARDFYNKYHLTFGLESSPNLLRRGPPVPTRRESLTRALPYSVIRTPVSVVTKIATSDENHLHHRCHPPPSALVSSSSRLPQLNSRPSTSVSWRTPPSSSVTLPRLKRQPSIPDFWFTPVSCSLPLPRLNMPLSISRSGPSVNVDFNEGHEVASLTRQLRDGLGDNSEVSYEPLSSLVCEYMQKYINLFLVLILLL